MDKVMVFAVFGIIIGAGLLLHMGRQEPPPLAAVEELSLERYMGTWYEIASIPASFQRRCVEGTTATYSLLEDGTVEVLNRCVDAEGRIVEARGRAWPTGEPGKLKVSFVSLLGWDLFPAPYWVIDLAPDYSYAVVGHPSRSYGWILSRTPTLPEETLESLFQRLRAQGYDPARFRMTPQGS